MSRSFKKHPIGKAKSRFAQKQAARSFRRKKYSDVPDGKYYKRLYPMWDVIDYSWRIPFKEFMNYRADSFEERAKRIEYVEESVLMLIPHHKGSSIIWVYDMDNETEELTLVGETRFAKCTRTITRKYSVEDLITYKNSTEKDKEGNYPKWKKWMLRK